MLVMQPNSPIRGTMFVSLHGFVYANIRTSFSMSLYIPFIARRLFKILPFDVHSKVKLVI